MTTEIPLARSFACSCSTEGKTKCAETLAWAYEKLHTTAEHFVTRVIFQLHWQYGAEITGIPTDQWSRVDTKTWTGEDFDTHIQCDFVEDGLAFTLKAYDERFPLGNGGETEVEPIVAS